MGIFHPNANPNKNGGFGTAAVDFVRSLQGIFQCFGAPVNNGLRHNTPQEQQESIDRQNKFGGIVAADRLVMIRRIEVDDFDHAKVVERANQRHDDGKH